MHALHVRVLISYYSAENATPVHAEAQGMKVHKLWLFSLLVLEELFKRGR